MAQAVGMTNFKDRKKAVPISHGIKRGGKGEGELISLGAGWNEFVNIEGTLVAVGLVC